MEYTNEQLHKDIEELKFENRVQTLAVVMLFLFGISTIHDIIKKIE